MDDIKYTENDKIDRKELVDKVYGIVNSLKENKNICLAINGEWGSGKSYVMGMLDEKFSKSERYVVVKYDAWKNSFYEEPLISILTCIYEDVREKAKSKVIAKDKIKGIAIKTAETIVDLTPFGTRLKTAAEGIEKVVNQYQNPYDNDRTKEYKTYRELLAKTQKYLNDITTKGEKYIQQKRLVILVDEIDRCLPNEQLKILERLHHLFDVNNCAVIVAVNEKSVSKTINTLYGVDGYEYLRKFFDYTFKIEKNSKVYLRSLLLDYRKYLSTIKYVKIGALQGIDNSYILLTEGEKDIFNDIDNRDIDRFYNSFLNVVETYGLSKITLETMSFIIIALFIRKNLDSNFLDIHDFQTNQLEIERIIENTEDENAMPFYDYFKKYLGIDRKKMSKGITDKYDGCAIIKQSYFFNRNVYLSRCDVNSYHYRINFSVLPDNIINTYIELRDLIIKYAGEQERTTNEK